MEFEIVPSVSGQMPGKRAYLVQSNWDDWFRYNTTYILSYVDVSGNKYNIGSLKIGEINQSDARPSIPELFEKLGDQFFSVGQDESYYKELNILGENIRDEILNGLNDIAFNDVHFEKARNQHVLHSSLLRSLTTASVKGKFRRLSHGGARLSSYKFTYKVLQNNPIDLSFNVIPESNPPTNIHALIGRNGVGKTHLISNMIQTVLSEGNPPNADPLGIFYEDVEGSNSKYEEMFANIVLVSFSAFDTSQLPQERNVDSRGIKYSYIGLRQTDSHTGASLPPKTPNQLADEFAESAYNCCQISIVRWVNAIETLETDPLFKAYSISKLTQVKEEAEFKAEARKVFNDLSSGHKIVLITMTRLIETVEERTLVLMDEPESHLHPPLLSALIRSLSDLLIHRNGVAIIATHSPVILQEIPRSCAWILRSSISRILAADRPSIETFGENIGGITREVFRLEVENTGFHKLLQEAVGKYEEYDSVIDAFKGEIGHEAKALIRAMIANKE
ncbi:hypothetical protein BHU72_01925 [Desulfuribacillus stibiiarsenatis]|uniref:ATPase AAA-type core domain-containing protein n=1 Tax=Desulfuribacillus stibiiarsenatis TaxID=1390249 RepID=A0A1E5L635_9FIRM|nr:AAA family ATPase [Desulfuribacillus stibiiarsenatis]OEH85581.1 hypothetical protein BHU72_01925 [Desulfuribacillus stibiiarsenatis]